MNIDDGDILELGELVLRCKKIIDNEWDCLAVVYDTGEGHIANSGFIYKDEVVSPVTTKIENSPLLLGDKILAFREKIYEECGHKFKQLLIQMESETNRIKIDFEFDDPERWSIKPAKLKEMREKLRPSFS